MLMRSASKADAVYVNTTTIPWWIAASCARPDPPALPRARGGGNDGRLVLKALHAPLLFANRPILISDTALESACSVIPRLALQHAGPTMASPTAPVRRSTTVDRHGFPLAVLARLSPRKAPDVAIEATIACRTGIRRPARGGWHPLSRLPVVRRRTACEVSRRNSRTASPSRATWPRLTWSSIDPRGAGPVPRRAVRNSVVEAQLSAASRRRHGRRRPPRVVNEAMTGVLVPPRDAAATADAVNALLADESRRRSIGQRARTAAIDVSASPAIGGRSSRS